MADGDVRIVWDDAEIAAIDHNPQLAALQDRIGAEAVSTMKFLTPVSPVGPLHRSGNLRSSVRMFRGAQGAERFIIVGPTADYAKYVNNDTVPHLIESHGPWPLRNRETGQVFGRVVHHPGTHGQHFVEKTAETFQGRVYHIG